MKKYIKIKMETRSHVVFGEIHNLDKGEKFITINISLIENITCEYKYMSRNCLVIITSRSPQQKIIKFSVINKHIINFLKKFRGCVCVREDLVETSNPFIRQHLYF